MLGLLANEKSPVAHAVLYEAALVVSLVLSLSAPQLHYYNWRRKRKYERRDCSLPEREKKKSLLADWRTSVDARKQKEDDKKKSLLSRHATGCVRVCVFFVWRPRRSFAKERTKVCGLTLKNRA